MYWLCTELFELWFLLGSSCLRAVSKFILFYVSPELRAYPVYVGAQQKYLFFSLAMRIALSIVSDIGIPENRL